MTAIKIIAVIGMTALIVLTVFIGGKDKNVIVVKKKKDPRP